MMRIQWLLVIEIVLLILANILSGIEWSKTNDLRMYANILIAFVCFFILYRRGYRRE